MPSDSRSFEGRRVQLERATGQLSRLDKQYIRLDQTGCQERCRLPPAQIGGPDSDNCFVECQQLPCKNLIIPSKGENFREV
jgi:hypothetical protein